MEPASAVPQDAAHHLPDPRVMSVLGPIAPEDLGVMDAHGHVWISRVPGADRGAPVLSDFQASLAELILFKEAGGGALVDCQPGGFGRDGRMLADLASRSGIRLLACTGFHLRKYCRPDDPIWQWTADQACAHFTCELQVGLEETAENERPIRAGFIKVACEAALDHSPLALLEGAAQASLQTGAAIEIHTEKGSGAEDIVNFFFRQAVPANRMVICHIDKRPEFSLHRDLAQAGIMLEYDTFYRPKYDPERHAWPLLARMLEANLDQALALALDFAESSAWKSQGGEPGLAALLTGLPPRLKQMGSSDTVIRRLIGNNIARRLAYI